MKFLNLRKAGSILALALNARYCQAYFSTACQTFPLFCPCQTGSQTSALVMPRLAQLVTYVVQIGWASTAASGVWIIQSHCSCGWRKKPKSSFQNYFREVWVLSQRVPTSLACRARCSKGTIWPRLYAIVLMLYSKGDLASLHHLVCETKHGLTIRIMQISCFTPFVYMIRINGTEIMSFSFKRVFPGNRNIQLRLRYFTFSKNNPNTGILSRPPPWICLAFAFIL